MRGASELDLQLRAAVSHLCKQRARIRWTNNEWCPWNECAKIKSSRLDSFLPNLCRRSRLREPYCSNCCQSLEKSKPRNSVSDWLFSHCSEWGQTSLNCACGGTFISAIPSVSRVCGCAGVWSEDKVSIFTFEMKLAQRNPTAVQLDT